jgi:hypothetical protein
MRTAIEVPPADLEAVTTAIEEEEDLAGDGNA